MFKRIIRATERIPAITAPLFVALFGGLSLATHMRRKASTKKQQTAKALPAIGLTQQVIAELPRKSYYANGKAMESMNIIMIASKAEIRQLYKSGGWYEALPVSFLSLLRAQLALIFKMQFLH